MCKKKIVLYRTVTMKDNNQRNGLFVWAFQLDYTVYSCNIILLLIIFHGYTVYTCSTTTSTSTSTSTPAWYPTKYEVGKTPMLVPVD